jgi:hypothetical protein
MLDIDIRTYTSASRIPARLRHDDMCTHVLLAACGEDEIAHEACVEGHTTGVFTKALIPQLYHAAQNPVTYSGLMDRLPPCKNQKLHCGGAHKDRFLFDGKSMDRGPKEFVLTKRDGEFLVRVGTIGGVSIGTEFIVHFQATGSPSRVLLAKSVGPSSSTLDLRPGEADFEVPEGTKAQICRSLKVCDPQQLLGQSQHPHHRTSADIAIKWDSTQKLVIERLDDLIGKCANRTVSRELKNPFESLPAIIDAIAHFNFFLRHRNPNKNEQLEGFITMELHRLTKPTMAGGFRTPAKLIGKLHEAKITDLVEDKTADFGIAIHNHSGHALYPYLFYFDPSDYSIQVRSHCFMAT